MQVKALTLFLGQKLAVVVQQYASVKSAVLHFSKPPISCQVFYLVVLYSIISPLSSIFSCHAANKLTILGKTGMV